MSFSESFLDFLHFMNNYVLHIVVAIILYKKRDQLFESLFLQPIRGGNGVTQSDELAKYSLIGLLIFMVYIERQPGEQYASEIFMFIAASVAGLAGLKRHYDHIKNERISKKEHPADNSSESTTDIK